MIGVEDCANQTSINNNIRKSQVYMTFNSVHVIRYIHIYDLIMCGSAPGTHTLTVTYQGGGHRGVRGE